MRRQPEATASSGGRIKVEQTRTTAVFCLLSEADYLVAGDAGEDYASYVRAFHALQTEALDKGYHPFTVLYDPDDFRRMEKLGKFGTAKGSEARAMWAFYYFQDRIARPRQAHHGADRWRLACASSQTHAK